MMESSEYNSLFELVNSHLSKTSLQGTAGNSNMTFNIPPLMSNGSASESLLSMHNHPRLPIPTLGTSESPIQSILDKQVANMLKAKEKKRQEELKAKLVAEMRLLQIEDDKKNFIDLKKAIETPYHPTPRLNQQEPLIRSSSMESFKLSFTDCDDKPERSKTPEPPLPCITDMSYILKEKGRVGKCSSFGKVLTSQYRKVAAPYMREKIPKNIVRFDFNAPSPSDITKANLRKPTRSCTWTMDITKFK